MPPINLSDAVAYYRVSTPKQAEEYSSLKQYQHRMEDLGFPAEDIYYDVGSGGDNNRASYLIILSKIRSGLKKKVYVPDLSRFTRSVEGWEEAIKDFQIAGATIITLEGIEIGFDTPEQRLISRQMVGYSAYEREKNQYRALRGHEYLRVQGKLIKPRFPYLKCPETGKPIPNNTLYTPTETVWQVAEWMIVEFINNSRCVYRLQRALLDRYGNRKNPLPEGARFGGVGWEHEPPRNDCSIRDWLKSALIRGHMEYFRRPRSKGLNDRKFVEAMPIYNNHRALIGDREYQEIMLILGLPKPRANKEIRNPLNGLIFCGGCGSKMILKNSRSTARTSAVIHPLHQYVRCEKSFKHQRNKEVTCARNSAYGIEIEDVEHEVIQHLKASAEIIAAEANFTSGDENESAEIIELRSRLATYEQLAKSDSKMMPIVHETRRELDILLAASIDEDSAELKKELIVAARDDQFWLGADIYQRGAIYADLVEAVVIDEGRISVSLDFFAL